MLSLRHQSSSRWGAQYGGTPRRSGVSTAGATDFTTRYRYSMPTGRIRLALLALAVNTALGPPAALVAQDSTQTRLAPVRVTVTRDAARPALDLPFALTRVDVAQERNMVRSANFTELLFGIPGLTVFTRFNPTQDPRVAIRGFGARSAFGIRGVRVLRDGIPLTLADGQTAVDFLDIETVGAAEVLRGSAGALYGNSSGGVVDLRTPPPPDSGTRTQFRTFSAASVVRGSLYAGVATPLGRWQAVATRNYGDGPRMYSAFSNASYFLDGRWSSGGTEWQAQVTRYDSPRAQNPGAVTKAEVDTAYSAADPTNVTRKASKAVHQTLASLSARRAFGAANVAASVFAGARDLYNPQPFAIVAFDRATRGGSLRAQYERAGRLPLRFSGGVDIMAQSDDRRNYENCAGLSGASRPISRCPASSDRGAVTIDQRERVSSLGMFGRAELQLLTSLSASAALRSDQTRFSVLDRRPVGAGGRVAPSRTLGAVTPMVGLNWRPRPLASFYLNFAESFETPTTTELANQPDGQGGLNRELQPQHGRTYEAGAKGALASRLRFDLAIYSVRTTDELIPFEVPNSDGRRFFRNAGATSRHGAELALGTDAGPFTIGGSWTALRYVYDDYVVLGTSFTGKRVPGVAPVVWSASVATRAKWGVVAMEWQHAGRTHADDANRSFADAYTLMNVRAGLRWGTRFGIEPSAGIDNAFDRHYAANIVTNAARSRYFEPGTGRLFWIGLRLTADTRGASR
ncbi:MAG: Vitamin B12 transporter BtuB [Gemmatimonadaceae bacterium]|nr:Vitamin B12 transporter BtuB [Gemmatimonadaceae bacterium]